MSESDKNDTAALWRRFQDQLFSDDATGFRLDVSRMDLDDAFFARMAAPAGRALEAMRALEGGAIANPDEGRMVGHYWLRDPARAPRPEIRQAIEGALQQVRSFARDVHDGRVKPQRAAKFENVLVIGIGGSALGPQLVADALGGPRDPMRPFFFDNTDPDGMDRALAQIGEEGLASTLAIVISKSGGTKETRNGMLEARAAYERQGLDPAKHFVAVTGEGSELDAVASREGWIARFPMWDWVGGRTSELAAVGLLPAALQGIDVEQMLAGARAMDELTREGDARRNPAMLLALSWWKATGGRGEKDMVVLPYKDRLVLLSKYLQQLVMESLGKEKDLDGKVVHQGIAVYGNKGSTDQHAYVQQLRDGVPNFFATFIEVRKDREGASIDVEPGVASGDYLLGFLLGTRRALYESGRPSITLSVPDVSGRTVGMLVALYERAVGFYASLVNINAYHQPGVEAGKKAAAAVLDLQRRAVAHLAQNKGEALTAEQVAKAIGAPGEAETVFFVLEHLADNERHVVRRKGDTPVAARFAAR